VVDGLLDSKEQAIQAVENTIRVGRAEAAQALSAAGMDAGQFVTLLDRAQITVYPDQNPAQPQVMTLSV
jgi:hypothetical protein